MDSFLGRDLEAREHAEELVKYFDRIIRDFGDSEVWQKGLTTAQEWLRLIKADNVSSAELSAFIGVVHANWDRSSGWWTLAGGAYEWVRTKDATVAPEKEFFAHENVLFPVERDKAALLGRAHRLLNTFERYRDEDPTSELWSIGFSIVRKWLSLMDAEEVILAEISELTESVMKNSGKFAMSLAWLDTEHGVWRWCKTVGHSEIIPDSWRSMLSKQDGKDAVV